MLECFEGFSRGRCVALRQEWPDPSCGNPNVHAEEKFMSADASIAKQVVQDEIESQINTAKAELEVLTSRVRGTMAKTEVEAYETLSPKVQAIRQKLQELKKSTGAQWQQTKADLDVLITDFKESVKEIASAAEANESRRLS
jgi:hypothetical protein